MYKREKHPWQDERRDSEIKIADDLMRIFFSETGSYQVTDQQASNTQRSCHCLPSTETGVCILAFRHRGLIMLLTLASNT